MKTNERPQIFDKGGSKFNKVEIFFMSVINNICGVWSKIEEWPIANLYNIKCSKFFFKKKQFYFSCIFGNLELGFT